MRRTMWPNVSSYSALPAFTWRLPTTSIVNTSMTQGTAAATSKIKANFDRLVSLVGWASSCAPYGAQELAHPTSDSSRSKFALILLVAAAVPCVMLVLTIDVVGKRHVNAGKAE